MIPSACPDGNDDDPAAASAVEGRGRSTAAFATTVTRPMARTVTVRKAAIQGRLFSRATMATTIARIRSAVGPSRTETAFQNSTQAAKSAHHTRMKLR